MKLATTQRLVALLAVGALALTGCSAAGRGSGTEGSGTDALLTVTPEPAGELDHVNWSLPYGEPASIDPIKGVNYPENQVTANLCDTLVQMQPDLSIAPNLATEWEERDDRTFVFQIRDDVKFWDGSPLTMADVVYSVTRNLDPAEGSFWAGSAANIASAEQTGDWEMTVTLDKPDTTFVETFTTPVGAVVQQKQREEAGQDFGNPGSGIMCTGPFSIKEWKQGQSITLERNDDYWNADRKAKAKEFQIDFVVDATAITNSLTTGEIQGAYDVPLPAISQLSSSTTGTLYAGQGMQLMGIIAQGDGPFGDPIVRRAITQATDRQAIADTVYEGTASPARSIVPETNWMSGPDVESLREERLPDLSFDIEAAKRLLATSKADLNTPIKVAYPSERTFYADILNEVANGAKELGLTFTPVGVPSAQFGAFFSDPEARKGYDGFVTINYPTSPSPILYIAGIAGAGGDQNFNDFNSPEVEAAIEAAQSEADPKRRAELSVEAEALMMEQMPWIPVAQLNARLYMDNAITGAPASFSYLNYPWAADIGSTK